MVKQMGTMLLSLFIALAFFMPESADAANCQGLSSSKCKSNSNCVWVSGYTRKGARVKAYCRAKPTRSAVKNKRTTTKKKRVVQKRRITKKKTTPEKKRVVKKRRVTKKKTTPQKKRVVKKRKASKKKTTAKRRVRKKKTE